MGPCTILNAFIKTTKNQKVFCFYLQFAAPTVSDSCTHAFAMINIIYNHKVARAKEEHQTTFCICILEHKT